jgi:hypothetical protein
VGGRGVGVEVGINVGVSVAVGVGDGVEVGVRVGVSVGEEVEVAVKVTVAVGVDVAVGVGVANRKAIGLLQFASNITKSMYNTQRRCIKPLCHPRMSKLCPFCSNFPHLSKK